MDELEKRELVVGLIGLMLLIASGFIDNDVLQGVLIASGVAMFYSLGRMQGYKDGYTASITEFTIEYHNRFRSILKKEAEELITKKNKNEPAI